MMFFKFIGKGVFWLILFSFLSSCSHYWGSSGGISYTLEDAKENCGKYGKVPKITGLSRYHDIGYICIIPK
jgi:hypothetical protein